MSKRDIGSELGPVQHFALALTATQTPTNGVDLRDFGGALVLAFVGIMTNVANSPQPSWTLSLQESDTVNSAFTNVAEADMVLDNHSNVGEGNVSNGIFQVIDAAAEDDTMYSVGYIGTKRYIRVIATAANTPGSTPMAVCICRGLPHNAPVSH